MDFYEELKKYKELLDEGIITQEEFEERKKKVLSKQDSPSLYEHSSTSMESMESNSESKPSNIGNTIKAARDNSEVIEESDSQNNDSSNSKATKGKSKKTKFALIGALCFIAVVAIVTVIFLNNDIRKIQGSWDMTAIVTDGKATAPIAPISGSLNVTGKKWTMELHGTTTDTYTGTVESSEKATTNEGTAAIFYSLNRDGGKTLKAAYLPSNSSIMVCTSIIFDSDNGIIFTKK